MVYKSKTKAQTKWVTHFATRVAWRILYVCAWAFIEHPLQQAVKVKSKIASHFHKMNYSLLLSCLLCFFVRQKQISWVIFFPSLSFNSSFDARVNFARFVPLVIERERERERERKSVKVKQTNAQVKKTSMWVYCN